VPPQYAEFGLEYVDVPYNPHFLGNVVFTATLELIRLASTQPAAIFARRYPSSTATFRLGFSNAFRLGSMTARRSSAGATSLVNAITYFLTVAIANSTGKKHSLQVATAATG
jgi:hypothetical protein